MRSPRRDGGGFFALWRKADSQADAKARNFLLPKLATLCKGDGVPPTKRVEAEAVVPGLADCLAAWRNDGDTFTEIAWRLRTDHGVIVSAETVRQWCADDGPAAA